MLLSHKLLLQDSVQFVGSPPQRVLFVGVQDHLAEGSVGSILLGLDQKLDDGVPSGTKLQDLDILLELLLLLLSGHPCSVLGCLESAAQYLRE